MVHIDDLPFLGDTQISLGILFSCVVCQFSYLTRTILPSFSFLFLLVGYACMWRHYGFSILGIFSGPFSEALGLTIDIFWWYRPFHYGGLCPIYFLKELGSSGFIFVL
jgi:hypothetical protein